MLVKPYVFPFGGIVSMISIKFEVTELFPRLLLQ